jgi:glycine betaine/proline transport system substrate-binding protein
LGAEPSWVQYDESIIANLGLPLEVVWSGSEDALLAEVDASVARQDPILFYFYTPHAVFDKYDMTQVELPPYSDECYANADSGSVDCAYPADVLMKIFATDLKDRAPEAHTLLSNMNYNNADQVAMLGAVEGGMSIEEAAQQWVDENESVWSTWLP